MPLGGNGNPHPCHEVCVPGAWQVQEANLGTAHGVHIAFGSMSIFRVDDRDLLMLIMPWLDGVFARMGGLVICD